MDENRGIGINNKLPWRLSKDMAFFKKKTTGTKYSSKKHAVIMGRLTWESLPEAYRPLPDRVNIVVTRNKSYKVPPGVLCIYDLNDFSSSLSTIKRENNLEDIFIIGGSQLYSWAIKQSFCTTMYVTSVHSKFNCDAFFPEFDSMFNKTESSDVEEEKFLSFNFEVYSRIN
jgi:dihydrofolate reductase